MRGKTAHNFWRAVTFLSFLAERELFQLHLKKKFGRKKTTTKPKPQKAKQKAWELSRFKIAWLGNCGAASAHKVCFKK